MDTSYTYEIRVEGQLGNRWADWFDGLTIRYQESEGTTLTGRLPDQSALLGVLTKIHSLNLIIVSVLRQPAGTDTLAAQAELYIQP